MNKRTSFIRAAALVLVVAIIGQMMLMSGNNAVTASYAATAAATMAATAPAMMGTPDAVATCDKATGLTLYAAIGYDQDIAKIFTAKTGIAVNVVDDSTGPLLAKITAEGTNPQWDVTWFDGDAAMQALDDAGLLKHWLSANVANYTDLGLKVFPASHAYYPTGVTSASAIAYNTDKVKAKNIKLPTDWMDLLDPMYKNLIVESNPSISGPSYQHIASLATILGGVDKAKDYLTKLKANGLKIFDTSGPSLKQITTGDPVFAIVQDAGVYGKAAAGQPLAMIYPKSGVGVLPSVIAVSAKAAHLGCAQTFINYILSAEGQNGIAGGEPKEGDRYYIPIIKGAELKVKRQTDGINWVFLDIPAYAKIATDYKNWFRDNIAQ